MRAELEPSRACTAWELRTNRMWFGYHSGQGNVTSVFLGDTGFALDITGVSELSLDLEASVYRART
jgi:hypothetical protein